MDEPVSLKPGEVLVRAISDAGDARYSFRLLDSAGKKLLTYTEGELHAAGPEAFKLGAQPQPDWKALSLERALYNERQGELAFAANDYQKLLEQSPNDPRFLKGAGRIATIQQRFDEAQRHLNAAVQAAPEDAEAHYYLGVALSGRGDDAGARREWSLARVDKTLGRMAMVEEAAATARTSATPPEFPEATPLVIRAAFARNAGSGEAGGLVARARAIDPTDSAARFEEALQGGEAEGLWEHAADGERVLDIADLYMLWGLYADAEALLARSYPSLSESSLEPGAVPPGDDPLVAYYLAYCRQKRNEDSADYWRGASAMTVRYVFPFRAGSRDVLEAALHANPGDTTARYLLSLWLTNTGLANGPAPEPRSTAPSAEPLRSTAPNSPPPLKSAAPASPAGSPAEIAATALMAAADGDLGRARGYFNPQNFPAEKHDDAVRMAYIELELQRLLALAAERKCPEVDRLLTNIGAEDKSLPFTFHPFNALMRGARFQYYFGEAEAACIDEKSAHKRWEKVARMKPDPASSDFAYPYLAAAHLSQAAPPAVALEETRRRLESATDATRSALLYSQGLLLLATGQKQEARESFLAGQQAAPPGLVRYLNALALH